MKEKAFVLLKELLLLQSAGGFDMFNNAIELAIDVYCEITETDKEKFNEDLHAIQASVWHEGCRCSDFKSRQSTYSLLLDILKKGEKE